MKVEIMFPFIDYRKLEAQYKKDLLNEKPSWPSPNKGFFRCMGMIKPQYFGYTAKGIRLKNNHILGLIGLKRIIDFPFGNDIFGVYSLSFNFKKNSFAKSKPLEIFDYFYSNIVFSIKDLSNGFSDLPLKLLSENLKCQYFWATRKLELKDNGIKTKLYTRNSTNNQIVIETFNEEIKHINFLEPFFFLETTWSDSIDKEKKIKDYIKLKFLNTVGILSDKGFNIYHINRSWYDKNEIKKLSEFSRLIRSFKEYTLLFDFLYSISEDNMFLNDQTDVYVGLISEYISGLTNQDINPYFEAWNIFYLEKDPKKHINLIAKLNHVLLPDNKISVAIFNLVNKQIVVVN